MSRKRLLTLCAAILVGCNVLCAIVVGCADKPSGGGAPAPTHTVGASAPVPVGGDLKGNSADATVIAYNGSTIIQPDAGGVGCNVLPTTPGQFPISTYNGCYAPVPITHDLTCSTSVPGDCQVGSISGCVGAACYRPDFTDILAVDGGVLARMGPYPVFPGGVGIWGGDIADAGFNNEAIVISQSGSTTIIATTLQIQAAINGQTELQFVGGEFGLRPPLGGYTQALHFFTFTQAIDGGVFVLDANTASAPHLHFTGTLLADAFIVFPGPIAACWYIDLSGMVLGSFHVRLQAAPLPDAGGGNVQWGTDINAANAGNEFYVCYGDDSRLYGTTLTP